MPRQLVFALIAAGGATAAVPALFVPGQPAKAEEVNKNFSYLDSAVGTKATQSGLGTLELAVTGLKATKADQSALEEAIKLIASKVGTADFEKALKGKVDTAVVRSLSELVAKKADADQVNGLKDGLKDGLAAKADTLVVKTIGETLAKKADATWVTAQISASAPSGMLASGKNLSDLTDKAAARTNLGLGALAVKGSLGPADVGALASSKNLSDLSDPVAARTSLGLGSLALKNGLSASDVGALTLADAVAYFPKAEKGFIVSYKDYTAEGVPKRARLAVGDAQYGFSSAGGTLELYSATGAADLYQTTNEDPGVRVGRVATEEWAGGKFAVLNAAKPSGEWNFAGDPAKYVDPQPKVGRDAKFGGYGIATNGLHVNGDASVSGTIIGNLKGSVVATGIKASNVADYVFEPDYKLTSLSEVEAFTKTHKHLPEVPSAKEIEADGLDLARMNLLLLKKVEELTLHTIELEKRLKAVEGGASVP